MEDIVKLIINEKMKEAKEHPVSQSNINSYAKGYFNGKADAYQVVGRLADISHSDTLMQDMADTFANWPVEEMNPYMQGYMKGQKEAYQQASDMLAPREE